MKLVPRRWNLELRLEGSVDKELLDKIRLADPEITVLSPQSDNQGVQQSIHIETETGDAMPISTDGEPKVSEDGIADAPNPTTSIEAPAVEIKLLPEFKQEMKKTDTQDKSHRDDSASEGKSRAKRASLKGTFEPAVPHVAIKVAKDALISAREHAATSHNEVGGVLVGKHIEPKNKDDIYSVAIWDAIPGKDLVSRGASVTFTADTWSTAIREVEEKYGEDLYIVGWYHTHPGFGVFMSGYDRFIHENYFNEPWQVALVIDPHAGQEGFFAWHINDEKEQILEKYSQEIEFLAGAWHPPVKQAKDLTEPKEPTKEEPKETAAPVHVVSEKEKGEDKSEQPGRETVTPNAQVAENHALPSKGASGEVADDRSTQNSGIHREHVAQQTEKPPGESSQVSAPVSGDSTTPSANKVEAEVVSQQRLAGKKAGVAALIVSSIGITVAYLRGRK